MLFCIQLAEPDYEGRPAGALSRGQLRKTPFGGTRVVGGTMEEANPVFDYSNTNDEKYYKSYVAEVAIAMRNGDRIRKLKQ